MKPFLTEDFLLDTEPARRLYHSYAEHLPLVDYHCHIPPQEIYEDRRFNNLAEVWLGGKLPGGGVAGDHYKWRLMRANGATEEQVTGPVDPYEQYLTFVDALQLAIGNCMYHWCHLELKRFFGIEEPLTPANAKEVWEHCNKLLREDPGFTARGLVKRSNVAMIGTTDDPTDSLEWHAKIAADPSIETLVLPSFRPDKALHLHKPGFTDYLGKLAASVGQTALDSAVEVKEALLKRLDHFVAHGCKATDHGLDYVAYSRASDEEVEAAFRRAVKGEEVTEADIAAYQGYLLRALGRRYRELGIVMQIHYSCLRNTNARAFEALGPDAGFDSINSHPASVPALAAFLSDLEVSGGCPKTILYSLNPSDNGALDALIGCFQGGTPGKIQHGSAWWFNDTMLGMETQIRSLASMGLLGRFVGMLTDSRSFLSYTRHEYFRRIVCRIIGRWVADGEYPDDEAALKRIVEGISYRNAAEYFEII